MGTPSSCDVSRRGRRVFLIVDGDFRDGIAVPAAARFHELIGPGQEPFELVCLVKNIGKCGTPGRQAWQNELTLAKHRLTQVTVQCDSGLVRMAAAAICLHAGLKLRFIESSEDFLHVLGEFETRRAS